MRDPYFAATLGPPHLVIPPIFRRQGAWTDRYSWEANLEASVLLLDAVWDVSLANHVKGDFVTALPARDVLAFAESSSAEAVADLRTIIDRVTASRPDHQLSMSLYRRRHRVWLPD